MIAAFFLSGLLATAQDTNAASPTAAAGTGVTATTPAKPGDEKVICEQQGETGSRLGGHRVCKTRREWREDAFRDRMEIQGRQRRWDNGGG